MKKRTKAMMGLFLAAVCGFSTVMTGCGGSSGGGDDSVLKIAVPIPLTGESAKAGKELQDAITMAFEESDNKVGSYDIELNFVDATSDADKGALALEEAIVKDGAELALSSWNSSVAVAMCDVVAKYKIPWYFSSSASSAINEKVEGNDNAYLMSKIWPTSDKTCVGYFELIKELIADGKWNAEDVKYAIFADDTDFGRLFGTAVKDGMVPLNGEMVFEDYTAINVTDFYTSIAKIKESDADICFVELTTPAAFAAFAKQAQEANLPCLQTSDTMTEAANWYELGGDATDGILVGRSKLVTDRAMEFQKAFEDKYGYTPSATTGGINYDGAKFLIKCIEACEEKYGEVTSETMYQFGKEVLQTGGITYDDSVIVASYEYSTDGGIDPIVDEDHFYFQILQLDGGKEVVVWPESDREAEAFVPDYVQ